jgi:hypothetical protein
MDQERIEGLNDADRSWLAAHLAECERCSAIADVTARALGVFRALPIEIPGGLAERTRFRVRLRAEELHEPEPGNKILWILTFVSWALGVASAPLVWRGFAWFGHWADLPKPVWEVGFVLWWTVPALLALGVVLLERRGNTQEMQ